MRILNVCRLFSPNTIFLFKILNCKKLPKIIKIMKVVSSIGNLKNRSKDCQVVKRRGRLYVICKSDPRLKVRQGRAKMKRK